MTTQVTIRKEIEKLKEKTGTKEPRSINFTYWHPPNVDTSNLDVVKREGDWLTIRVKARE